MKSIIAVLCCAVAVGCTEATKSNSTDVTAKKPVIEEGRGTTKDHGSVTGDNSRTTPLDQKEDRTDLQITADIRKRVVDSKLSTAAQNVEIISADGIVTLRGRTNSAEEKKQIEKIAEEFAGTNHVHNELQVEPPK